MLIKFDGHAARGQQWSITLDNGTTLAGVSQQTALSALQGSGQSIRQAQIIVADAKLATAEAKATAI